MKSQGLRPKLSTSLLAVSLFVLVACNDSTAEQASKENVQTAVANTAEQAPTPAAKASNDAAVKKDEKIVLADATAATATPAEKPKKEAIKFVEGKHYFEIFPEINTDAAPGKVEVVELMWLGCPHCYHLEDDVVKYKKTMPEYIDFKQVPAMLNPVWSKDAETFYVAEVLDPKGEKQLLNKIFHAIHEQGRRLNNEDAVKRYFSQLGVSDTEYTGAKNSMAFKVKINRAKQISAGSQVTSVPSVIINGKYRTSPYTAGGEAELFQLIDMLAAKEKK